MKTNLRSIFSIRPDAAVALVAALAFGFLCVFSKTEAATPDIVWQTNAHGENVSVAFSGDGLHLASGGEDHTAIVWALSNRTAVTVVTTPTEVKTIALPPTASFLVTGGDDGATRLWSLPTGAFQCGGRPNERLVWSVDVSPDGSMLAVGKSLGRIEVAQAACVPGGLSLSDQAGDIFSVTFSPDGTFLASAGSGGSAIIWRLSDSSMLHNLTGHSILETNEDDVVINAVHSVDFSPDGSLLLTTGDDGTARLWRVSDGQQVRVLQGGGGTAGKFSADGKTLFTLENSAIRFWRVADGRLLSTFENTGACSLAVSPDGKHFAYGHCGGALVLARVPLWVEEVVQAGNQIVLRWQGGSGLYQLQRTTNVVSGPWENVGAPSPATRSTNAITGTIFYRVQSVPLL